MASADDISPALRAPCRSLAEYADELRRLIAKLDGPLGQALFSAEYRDEKRADLSRRLLAVEREINWRACI
jgi:hypothetical protein